MSKLSRGLRKAEKWISDRVPHTHEKDRRAMREETQQQIDYYRDLKSQAEDAKKENERMKDEERRKINQKRLRALRRRRSGGGFSDSDSEMSNKLG